MVPPRAPHPRRLAALLAAAICLGAVPPASAQNALLCSSVLQNWYVRDAMSDLYLWYERIPAVNALRYPSPEAYLEAIRYRPLDATFSYIGLKAAEEAFYSDSQFIGYGLSTRLEGAAARVLQVFPDSPAAEAGLRRGDRIVAINGVAVETLVATGRYGGAFGPAELGVVSTVRFLDQHGLVAEATMVKRLVTIPTVSMTRVFEVDGRRVGYVFFRNFVQPSFEALDVAFGQLTDAGVDEMVLDLRYNGGGLVSVAQHLASLLGGARVRGQVFAEYFHNDRNAHRNRVVRFEGASHALELDRLVVITTRSSASASELVINALRPFLPVLVVGETTYGKPVGQYGVPFCEKVLYPVSFLLRNAAGEGDFFGGFLPDCAAPDDADRQLGDPLEGSLAEALHLVGTGACRQPVASGTVRARRVEPRVLVDGWQLLVNAF